jgi:hypothetical protein
MRIPFFTRKPRDIATIAKKANYVGSAEAAGPRLRQLTPEEHERVVARFRSWRNGSAPPS